MSSSGAPRPFWTKHKELIALIGLVIAALIGLGAWLLPRGGDPVVIVDTPTGPVTTVTSPSGAEPKNVIEQIAQRRFWVGPPEVFRSAADVLDARFEPAYETHDILGGPPVVSPRDLLDDAVIWADGHVFLVGRVVRVRSIDDKFGFTNEYQLAPVGGTTAYVADDYAFSIEFPVAPPGEGDVIYASGKLAAVGESREPGGPVRASVYFLSDNVHVYEPGKTHIDSESLEKAVIRAARTK